MVNYNVSSSGERFYDFHKHNDLLLNHVKLFPTRWPNITEASQQASVILAMNAMEMSIKRHTSFVF